MQQSVNGWSAQNHKIPKKDSKQTANHVKVYCTSIQELSECFRCDIFSGTNMFHFLTEQSSLIRLPSVNLESRHNSTMWAMV